MITISSINYVVYNGGWREYSVSLKGVGEEGGRPYIQLNQGGEEVYLDVAELKELVARLDEHT